MITFPVLMLAGKIDWNEDTLFIGRLALSSVVLSTLIANFFLYQRVNQKKDKTKIFVPPPATPGLAGPTPGKGPPRETTYHEYECELVRQGANQAVMSAVISGGIHFYWGVNPPLVLQCIFIPLGVYDNLVFKKYILSDKKKNIYDETFSKCVFLHPSLPPTVHPLTSGGALVCSDLTKPWPHSAIPSRSLKHAWRPPSWPRGTAARRRTSSRCCSW